ncbi:MAG: alpha/beta hydrolase [Pararhodobacter sp.]|nr:alpha/beta hydrolase [Pararhodobacter sp.]
MRNTVFAPIALAFMSTTASAPAVAQDLDGIDPVTAFEAMPEPVESGYETVNGLEMFYQVHGEVGAPLILLHGGLMTIETLGPLLPALAETRTVYAVELEGHGRTRDLDRPLSLRQFADDVAGFIIQRGLAPADVVGFSMGGATALGLAAHHPAAVNRLAVISASHQTDSIYESVRAGWPQLNAELLAGTPMEAAYMAVAPEPGRFGVLVDKMRDAMLAGMGWEEDEIRAIDAPTLLIVGDTDIVQPAKVLELFQLLGGTSSEGPMGPQVNPDRQFAVLPGVTHYEILYRVDLLMPLLDSFLSADED